MGVRLKVGPGTLGPGIPLSILGRPLGSLSIYPYWFYRDPSILMFFKGL